MTIPHKAFPYVVVLLTALVCSQFFDTSSSSSSVETSSSFFQQQPPSTSNYDWMAITSLAQQHEQQKLDQPQPQQLEQQQQPPQQTNEVVGQLEQQQMQPEEQRPLQVPVDTQQQQENVEQQQDQQQQQQPGEEQQQNLEEQQMQPKEQPPLQVPVDMQQQQQQQQQENVEQQQEQQQQQPGDQQQQILEQQPASIDFKNIVHQHDHYSLLVNVDEELPFQQGPQIPFFWHIHKSGGSTLKHILTCLGRTQTRRMSEPDCSDQDNTLKICDLEFGSVVNVDASNPAGIARAIDLRLVDHTEFDKLVIATSRVYEAMPILKPNHRGRFFAVFRDPIDRAVSKFYYTKVATWERNYKPQVQNMTMLEYADSLYCYNDWMTRRLVNKMQGDLTPEDFETAKEVLRQKCLVLFTNNMMDAGERLVRYFRWQSVVTEDSQNCIKKFAVDEPINANPHPSLDPNTPEYKAIASRNQHDVRLYAYAQELYQQQTQLLNSL